MASIQKRVRNGKTTYSVNYRDPTGRGRRKVFDRARDAERWLHENETSKLNRAWVDPAAGNDRIGGWGERWYATTASLRPTTRHDYRALLDNQVLPAFAAARLVDIDALAVREWLAGLVGGGLSAKRARKAHQVLAQVLDAAVDGGRLARNVAAGVKLPKVQRREMGFLDAVQVEALADTIDPRYPTLVRFAAYTGLRPCELVALRVGRLDLLRGTVRVAEAAPEVAGRQASRPRCGSTTCAIRRPPCSSARAPASRRCSANSGTRPRASPWTLRAPVPGRAGRARGAA